MPIDKNTLAGYSDWRRNMMGADEQNSQPVQPTAMATPKQNKPVAATNDVKQTLGQVQNAFAQPGYKPNTVPVSAGVADKNVNVGEAELGDRVRSGIATDAEKELYAKQQREVLTRDSGQPKTTEEAINRDFAEAANDPAIRANERKIKSLRDLRAKLAEKDEKEERRDRTKRYVLAATDALRHIGNLYYTSAGAYPQSLGSAYKEYDDRETVRKARELKERQAERAFDLKLAQAQRDQYNKDRGYALKQEANKRERNLYPYKLQKGIEEARKAKALADLEEERKQGRIDEANYKAKKAQIEAEGAGEMQKAKLETERSKAERNKASAAKEYAHAGVYNRTDPNASKSSKGGSGGGRGKTAPYGHSKSDMMWDVPVSSQSQLNRELRTIVAKDKNKKWVEDYKNRTYKDNLSEGDYDRIAREHIGDAEIQNAIRKTGATERVVGKKKTNTQLSAGNGSQKKSKTQSQTKKQAKTRTKTQL